MPEPFRRVVVVGQGYVGLPLAMRAVEVGHHVVGLDTDGQRVARLLRGESYVEDVPDAVVAGALASGRYTPASDHGACEGFDVAVITVPTPLRLGAPDLSHIEEAAARLAGYVRPGTIVVLESTTYPGTTEELVAPALARGSGLVAGRDFHVGYSPERIDPGNTAWNLVNTPKVVSGMTAACAAAVDEFYRSIVDRTVPVSSPKEAELTKLLENTFRHVNIALVNELAMFAHDLGIDVWQAIDAASTKPFGYLRFTPGPGVGGHCLPVDPSYLSWRVQHRLGRTFRFIELANEVNDHMPEYVVRRLAHALDTRGRPLAGCDVLLLGLAYKPNTGDARESPAAAVAQQLVAMGATVRAADPHVLREQVDPAVELVELSAEQVRGADAVVLLTDHDAFDYEVVAANAAYVLDTRARLPAGDAVEVL